MCHASCFCFSHQIIQLKAHLGEEVIRDYVTWGPPWYILLLEEERWLTSIPEQVLCVTFYCFTLYISCPFDTHKNQFSSYEWICIHHVPCSFLFMFNKPLCRNVKQPSLTVVSPCGHRSGRRCSRVCAMLCHVPIENVKNYPSGETLPLFIFPLKLHTMRVQRLS